MSEFTTTERDREMALRAAILRHVRVPVKTLTLTLTGRISQPWGSYGASLRFLSSHGDDHLSKDEVIERVLSVIKSFPKVDPSQVSPSFSLFHFLEKIPVWFATKQFFYVSDFAPQINKLFFFFWYNKLKNMYRLA